MSIYQHPQPSWDNKKCEKTAKTFITDGLGTRYHLPGFLRGSYGIQYHNGGCIREGKWYAGENFPFPKIPYNFKIIYVPTWRFRLIKLNPEK